MTRKLMFDTFTDPHVRTENGFNNELLKKKLCR